MSSITDSDLDIFRTGIGRRNVQVRSRHNAVVDCSNCRLDPRQRVLIDNYNNRSGTKHLRETGGLLARPTGPAQNPDHFKDTKVIAQGTWAGYGYILSEFLGKIAVVSFTWSVQFNTT